MQKRMIYITKFDLERLEDLLSYTSLKQPGIMICKSALKTILCSNWRD